MATVWSAAEIVMESGEALFVLTAKEPNNSKVDYAFSSSHVVYPRICSGRPGDGEYYWLCFTMKAPGSHSEHEIRFNTRLAALATMAEMTKYIRVSIIANDY
jgi:hypothetical protein